MALHAWSKKQLDVFPVSWICYIICQNTMSFMNKCIDFLQPKTGLGCWAKILTLERLKQIFLACYEVSLKENEGNQHIDPSCF